MEWDRLVEDPLLGSAYTELATELQRATAVATTKASRMGVAPHDVLDLSRAFAILDQHPDLIRYLDDIAGDAKGRVTINPEAPIQNSLYGNYLTTKASPTAAPPDQQQSAGWAAVGKNVPVGVANSKILRDWADANEWVRSAINVRRQQIGRANIAVVPFNERRVFSRSTLKYVQMILDQPNELRLNYYEMMASMMDDLLVIDRGVLLKNMTVARKPVALYFEDGATIKIYGEWSGNPKEPRYLYEAPGGTRKVPLRNDEAIVMMANPATYRFGLSPVQVLRNTIQADLAATKSAIQMVDMKPPPHLIQLPGISPSQLEQVRSKYESDIAGRREIFWLGGPQKAEVTSLVFSAKDNQWLEWQVYLARKIATVFQVSPQQLGITFDINRATAESQQEIFEDTGLIPLLLLVEEYLNRELLGDFAAPLPMGRADMYALNLRIIFPEVTESDRQMHAERAINMAKVGLAGLPSMTLNQVLSIWGEEPVEGGNTFYILNQAMGAVPWLSYDGKTGGYGTSSTSGLQGGQDASGGPDQEEEIGPNTSSEDSDGDPSGSTDNAGTSTVGSDGMAGNSDGGASSAKAGRPATTKVLQESGIDRSPYRGADHRVPGKRWLPPRSRVGEYV